MYIFDFLNCVELLVFDEYFQVKPREFPGVIINNDATLKNFWT